MENFIRNFMGSGRVLLRLTLAGLLVIGLAPRAGADTLTGNEAYGKTLVDEVVWEKDITHPTAESSLGALSGSFAAAGISQSACPSAVTAAVHVTTDFTPCDIADPLNLSATSLASDGLAGAFAFFLTTESTQPPAGDSPAISDSESFPISSLWLLAGIAGVLILIGSRIIVGARNLRRSHRR